MKCVDEFPDLAEHYGVECIPCFRVLVGTRVVEKVDVANAQMLTSAVESALSSESKDTSLKPSVDDQLVIHPDINERLTRLVNSHPMMIFIKGLVKVLANNLCARESVPSEMQV